MAGTQGILPYLRGTPEEAADAIGITQFPSENHWFQTIGGLLIQGGKIEVGSAATLTVDFNASYPKQVFGVWIQPIGTSLLGFSVDAVTLDSFDIVNAAIVREFYWWAIGV